MSNISFEQKLSDLIPLEYFESFSFGRNVLLTLLRALELRPQDEVLLPPFTCSTINKAIEQAGLKPIPVDCTPNTINLCPQGILEKITNRTKVIFVVHTYGTAA